ncbi:MAG: hypothetical protein HIU84_12840 [Acidobacteria bacterium]|nr:hypothetical protein [Acidobacteriota bacterium]
MGDSPQTLSAIDIDEVVNGLRRVTAWERSLARQRLAASSPGRRPTPDHQFVETGAQCSAYSSIAFALARLAGVRATLAMVFSSLTENSTAWVWTAWVTLDVVTITSFSIVLSLSLVRWRQGIRAGRHFCAP